MYVACKLKLSATSSLENVRVNSTFHSFLVRVRRAFRYVVVRKCLSKLSTSLTPSAGRENRGQVSKLAKLAKNFLPGLACPSFNSGHGSVFRFSMEAKQFASTPRTYKCKIGTKGCLFYMYVRVGRIELPSVAWEATILPLNDTRNNKDKITKTSSQIKPSLLEQIDHTVKKPTNRRYYLCQTPRCKRPETIIFLITTII